MPDRVALLILTIFLLVAGSGLAQPEPQPAAPGLLGLDADHVLQGNAGTWLALGNSVVRVDPETGEAQWRKAVSGSVSLLEESNGGVSVVTSLPGGLRERITLDEAGRASGTVQFTVEPEVLDSLRQEALAADPLARLEYDTTNPWLYALAAAEAADPEEAAGLRQAALDSASTFYDLAGLAARFVAAGDHELAGRAMEASLQDFARRGYDPALLTDEELHAAYGFPLPHLAEAVQADDPEAAAFWAHWLEAFRSPSVPEVGQGLLAYADYLAGRGETALADRVRARAAPAGSELAATGMDRLFMSLGRSGWYMFASLVAVILALQVTLTLKYWEPQSLSMRRTLETGGSAGFLQRFLAIRFFSTTEKLVLALLYVTGLGILGLTAWTDRAVIPADVYGSGTLASAVAQDGLDALDLHGERGQFIRGYAAQAAGSPAEAELHYRAAPRFGPAVNNLAVLTGESGLFEVAERLSPGLGAIRWNQGAVDAQPIFQVRAGLDQPALIAPTSHDFQSAIRGNWQQALGSFFTEPLAAFNLEARWLPAQWIWYVLLGVYLLLGALTVLWIIVPRPRMARNAPRSAGYQLLALLVPGSGMADEVWGILLLVPWGLLGVDLVWRLAFASPLLDLGMTALLIALGVLYAVNLAAYIVEYVSYRRRMRRLLEANPDVAVAYGRRIEA